MHPFACRALSAWRRRQPTLDKVVQRYEHQAEVNAVEKRLDQSEQEAGPGKPGEAGQEFQPYLMHSMFEQEIPGHAKPLYHSAQVSDAATLTETRLHKNPDTIATGVGQKRFAQFPAWAVTFDCIMAVTFYA